MTHDKAADGKEGAGQGGVPHGIGVLRRLLREQQRSAVDGGRVPQLPQPAPPTPARAAATALGRAADRLYGLGVEPVEIAPGGLTVAELPELLPHPALLAVLQGPRDSVGVVALSPEAVTSLIEVQTIGRVTGRPVERRPLTRSDAMLCADFVDAFLSELAQEAKGVEGLEGLEGFRYITHLDDSRPLALMMEDKPCRSLRMTVRLGGLETRETVIFLALPQPEPAARPVLRPAADPVPGPVPSVAADGNTGASPQPAGEPVRAGLAASIPDAPVEVTGILCRRRISLRELRALAPGRLLALPRLNLAEARLETADGQLLATGKFGEADGCHAIRLRDPAAAGDAMEQPDSGATLPGMHPVDDMAEPDSFRRDRLEPAEIVPMAAAGGIPAVKGT